ncbi:hypothetical protein CTAYLR_005576 [Chrysophaeum taylorii]|uniref:N-acetyltransferase domain-containing protein n=1 Tax=Chrysophaeum taylorii TaxID=2483200 RepID=A0AAD7U4V0_9STRA|nr:hypothetical protein CTAYLR_005576 [Chrysophaeum taylorii]
MWVVVWGLVASGFEPRPAGELLRRRRRTRLQSKVEEATLVSVAREASDFEAAGKLCALCFPSSKASQHTKILRNPAALANVFFDAAGPSSLAVVREAKERRTVACAQLVPCLVREEACDDVDFSRRRAFWVQYVCVDASKRRRGLGSALMSWCEREASRAARLSEATNVDLWLAVKDDNGPALTLYDRLGFDAVEGTRRGHVVMRKTVPPDLAEAAEPRGPASRFDLLSSAGGPWGVVARSLSDSLLFAGLGLFGLFAVVCPAVYDFNPAAMARDLLVSGGPKAVVADVGVGLAAAIASQLFKNRQYNKGVVSEFREDMSYAAQKQQLWDLTSGATKQSGQLLAPLFFYLLPGVLSEELYYRGLVLNGLHRIIVGRADHIQPLVSVVAAAFALLFSSTIFALAHVDWVQDDEPDADAKRLDWIKETFPDGLVFGLLLLLTNSRLVAPVVAHLATNFYWTLVEIDRFYEADRASLAAVFDDLKRRQRNPLPSSSSSSSSSSAAAPEDSF